MMKRILPSIILSVLLLAGQANAKRLAVGVAKANVRSGPGTNHEILWSVGKYYPVDTVKKSGNWYKIRDFEDDQGWVFHSLLKKIPTVIVKAPLVNVREGPGTKSRVVFRLKRGSASSALEKKATG